MLELRDIAPLRQSGTRRPCAPGRRTARPVSESVARAAAKPRGFYDAKHTTYAIRNDRNEDPNPTRPASAPRVPPLLLDCSLYASATVRTAWPA